MMRPGPDRKLTPAWRRAAAAAIDYGLLLVWLALLTAITFVLRHAWGLQTESLDSGADRIQAQAIVALVLTVPVIVWLGWWEAKRGATPGKRVMGLHVEGDDGRRVSMPRALLRSGIKVALPWELAHAALWQTIGHDATPVTFVLVGMTYLVSGAHVALLCFGGRPIYDRVAGTVVRRSDHRVDGAEAARGSGAWSGSAGDAGGGRTESVRTGDILRPRRTVAAWAAPSLGRSLAPLFGGARPDENHHGAPWLDRKDRCESSRLALHNASASRPGATDQVLP